MRIQTIQIKNTGVFDYEKIDFELSNSGGAEIHIFTGPNGSGKSTILHALASGFNYKNTKDRCQMIHNDFYKRFHYFEETENKQHKSEVIISLSNETEITSWGCPKCKNMHITNPEGVVQEYQTQMGQWDISRHEFEFAVYASSGYRMVDYEEGSTGQSTSPLFHSLEFEKKKPHTTSIEDWIRQALQNKYAAIGMAKEIGSEDVIRIHSNVVDRITDAIRKVVGNEFDFVLQLQPSAVKFKYGKSARELDFNLLADGLKSLISWMVDLARMLDGLNWKDKTRSILDQNVIIFLDEIEVHLHPLWQRKVLPMVSTLFPNAQIFASSHSPFIINSIDGAWIYKLQTDETGVARVIDHYQSNTANSYLSEYIATFGIDEEFGESTQAELNELKKLTEQQEIDKVMVKEVILKLLKRKSIAVENTIGIVLRRLKRQKNIDIEL